MLNVKLSFLIRQKEKAKEVAAEALSSLRGRPRSRPMTEEDIEQMLTDCQGEIEEVFFKDFILLRLHIANTPPLHLL